MVGLRGLGSEVVKNVVLAGVCSITVLDHAPLSKDDFAGRFLMRQDGKNVSAMDASLTVFIKQFDQTETIF